MLRMKCANLILAVVWGAALAVNAIAAPLTIDFQQSKIQVAVSSTIDSFVGHLDKFESAIDCDPKDALPAKADVTFDFANLKTGNPDRDATMLGWLAYATNPMASFHLSGWKQTGTTNVASGRLTIHGVSKAVEMPTLVTHEGTKWEISGQVTLDYRDFNLPKIRKALVLTVDPKLVVTFRLVGQLSPSK